MPLKAAHSALHARKAGKPLLLTVRWLGGAQGWWLVEARGTRWYMPSGTDLAEVMRRVNRSVMP